MPAKGSGKKREENILQYCDGLRTSKEIAALANDNPKYAQRVMKKHNAPRLPQAPRRGEHNPSYKSGRRIDRDGYVILGAPKDHPYARPREGRNYGIILEHRLIVEKKLGRFLLPSEVVDHIDGLRLHNDPDNLRIFDSNAQHLKATITGQTPQYSYEGYLRLTSERHLSLTRPPVHTYNRMKKNGDARLREILLAAIALGKDSPFLLGSSHHLEKAGIVDLSRSSLLRALDDLYHKYA